MKAGAAEEGLVDKIRCYGPECRYMFPLEYLTWVRRRHVIMKCEELRSCGSKPDARLRTVFLGWESRGLTGKH